MEVPTPVISGAVMQLFLSRDGTKNWARAIAMMRRGFGGHPYGRDEDIARARRTERVGDYVRPTGGKANWSGSRGESPRLVEHKGGTSNEREPS